MTIYDFYKFITEDYRHYSVFLIFSIILFFCIRNIINYCVDQMIRIILSIRAPIGRVGTVTMEDENED